MTTITWKIHINHQPDTIYQYLSTDEGREKFWVEQSQQAEDTIDMIFPSGFNWKATILQQEPSEIYSIRYIDNSLTTFRLEQVEDGTIVHLEDILPEDSYYMEVRAGWVSVLMNMKSVIETGHDLRNHHPQRTWDQQFCNN